MLRGSGDGVIIQRMQEYIQIEDSVHKSSNMYIPSSTSIDTS